MASTVQFSAHMDPASEPTIHDGMIVVRRPANSETAIFWTSHYFRPIEGDEPTDMDFEAFLNDLRIHLRYDPAHDDILFHLPTPYELFPLDPALPGVEIPRDIQPVTCIVRDYNHWIWALVAMQSSRLMQQSNIEYALRDGFVTTRVRCRSHPVAASQFFLVRDFQAREMELQLEQGDDLRNCWTLAIRQRLD